MLYKSIRYLFKRGRGPAAVAVAVAFACVGVVFAQTYIPDRITELTVTGSTTTTADLSWRLDPDATEYEVGIWVTGLIAVLPLGSASATVNIPEPFEAVPIIVRGSSYQPDDAGFLGFLSSNPSTFRLYDSSYNGNITIYGDYHYNTSTNSFRQEVCVNNANCRIANRSQGRSWIDMPNGGPANWEGVHSSEADALRNLTTIGQLVIFPNAVGALSLYKIVNLTATADVTGIPSGRHYFSVRGKNRLLEGDWAYLVTVGTASADPTPVAGAPAALSGIIYTDEVPNIEHYLLDETTLILAWQNIPGARHYDVRINGEVTRIPALASSGQQVALSLASLEGQNLSYQVRAVIETGTLDVRVKDTFGELIYIVPPNFIVYSRWSADRSLNVERLGMIKGPGTESLMADRGAPGETVTGVIGDVLKVSTLVEEDVDQDSLQVWTVPLGLLGSIFMGGLTGYGARRGGLDKAAVVAGGLVFFVCWAYLCPVYLRIDWMIVFAVLVLVIGAAIVVVLQDFFR